jgi:hypothetical protein
MGAPYPGYLAHLRDVGHDFERNGILGLSSVSVSYNDGLPKQRFCV